MSTAEGKKRIQVTLSDTLIDRLDAYCVRTGISRSAYIAYTVGSTLDSVEAMQIAAMQAVAAQTVDVDDIADAKPNEAGNYIL